MAEKLASNEETLRPPLGADVAGVDDADDDEDDEGTVVVGVVAFFEELHAVPKRLNAARRDTLPARTLFLLLTHSSSITGAPSGRTQVILQRARYLL
ncbi:MAG TPA: hypothetical protein VFH58_09600 [Acidimicrobiales bacterium]|nr:hypothetical protein [Acidimicrobiales bacterium]